MSGQLKGDSYYPKIYLLPFVYLQEFMYFIALQMKAGQFPSKFEKKKKKNIFNNNNNHTRAKQISSL